MKNRPSYYNALQSALSELAVERSISQVRSSIRDAPARLSPQSTYYLGKLKERDFELINKVVIGDELTGQKEENFKIAASKLGDDLYLFPQAEST